MATQQLAAATSPKGGGPAANPGRGSAPGAQQPSTGKSKPPTLTIELSAIVAAIWAGIWGFNWAASHLSGPELSHAIWFGLIAGVALTVYVIERTFWAVGVALKDKESVQVTADAANTGS